jgi:hypothetical protein
LRSWGSSKPTDGSSSKAAEGSKITKAADGSSTESSLRSRDSAKATLWSRSCSKSTLRSRSNTEPTLGGRSSTEVAEPAKSADVSAWANQAGTTKSASGSSAGCHARTAEATGTEIHSAAKAASGSNARCHARATEATGTEIHSAAKALCKGVDGHDSCNCEDDESSYFLHSRSP